jgi:hypothetical protein
VSDTLSNNSDKNIKELDKGVNKMFNHSSRRREEVAFLSKSSVEYGDLSPLWSFYIFSPGGSEGCLAQGGASIPCVQQKRYRT